MPKLTDRWVKARGDDDTEFSEKVSVNVTVDGEFTVGVPEALEQSLLAFCNDRKEVEGVGIKIVGGRYRLVAKSLDAAIRMLNKCAADHLKCAVETERLIVYGCSLDVHFWLNKNGSMVPNGGSATADRDGRWWEPRTQKFHSAGMQCASFYHVGFAAAVYDKQTFKRKSGDTVKWLRVRESEDPAIDALNGFARLSVDPELDDMRSMPYSPQAAEFFFAVLMGMCKLGKSIDDFLGDDKRLRKAIAQGGGPKLLTG